MNYNRYQNNSYIQSMPQYGFGSWMKDNIGNVGSVGGGVMSAVGAGLTTTGIGAPVGLALMGAGAVAKGLGDNYNDKMSQEQQFASQDEALAMQQKNQGDQAAMMNRNNLIQSRLSGINQGQQQQYGSAFANGGYIASYANGGNMNRLNPSYNSYFPQKMTNGQNMFITPTTTKTLADTNNFKQLNDYYSYYSDEKLVPDYGNVRPATMEKNLDLNNNMKKDSFTFRSDSKGDSSIMESIFEGNFNPDEHEYIPSLQNGGGMKPYGGKLDTSRNPVVSTIDNGGTHQQNPLNGVPQGNRGLVEEGEVKAKIGGKDYIFSNRF